MELKEFRLKNNLSQTEFAKIIGIPRQTYQTYEYGTRSPSNSNLILIENAMRKIESERADINAAVDRLQAIKSYKDIQKYWDTYHQQIDDDFFEEDKFNLWLIKIIMIIILVFIFAVLW